jgi:succinate-semialdehyde dehydrogenase / glutarate-semialdehyde dehydrogenase
MSTDLSTVHPAFIAGTWHTPENSFEVRSPVDGTLIACVADCGPAEAERALAAAASAFHTWRAKTVYERAAVLMRWQALLLANEDRIARLIASEMGKPVVEGRAEVKLSATLIGYYAEEAKRVNGELVPSQFADKRLIVTRQPVGPVFAITPWNFPASMVARKVAAGLAVGCSIILKPAEQSPLTALALARLWVEAGGPPDVLQVLTTHNPAPIGRQILSDPRIRKLTFTGSTEVGRLLNGMAAPLLKHVSMELGGHAPFLVFADADITAAAREVLASKFRNAGQTCVCTNRVYVHRSIAEKFNAALTDLARSLKVGDPQQDDTQVGPLVDAAALAKTQAHVDDAVQRGATVLTGGQPLGGLFFQPTVLSHVTDDMRIMHEETFGPVAPVMIFDDEQDVIARANATPYGLAAYVWTRDAARVFRVSEALDYGLIGINDGLPATPQAPFGGMKDSGFGREGGKWGLEAYLETKFVSLKLV